MTARIVLATSNWGQPSQQMDALSRAIAYEERQGYLPEDSFLSALQALFALQIQTEDFGGALQTWDKLDDLELDPIYREGVASMVAEIDVLQEDDRAYAVDVIMGARTSWFIRLLKNRFRIDQVDGDVAELKLRCDRKYVLFRHDPDIEYRINDRYGDCVLEVIGDPGTTFRLVQS